MRKVFVIGLAISLSILTACADLGTNGVIQDQKEILTDEYVLNLINNAPDSQDFPDVPAIFLLDEEKAFFNKDGTGEHEFHVIWKMVDKKATELGEISIPYNAATSSLTIEYARTIRPDNTIVPVKKASIRDVSPFSDFPMYSDIRFKQFSMPAMEIGSVIDYKAIMKIHKPIMPGYFNAYLSFPIGFPIMRSIFEMNVPADAEIAFKHRNFDISPKIVTEGERKIFKWVSKDVFIKNVYEQYVPPYNEVCPNVIFAVKREWEEVANWFTSISTPRLGPSQEMKDYVSKVVSEQKNDRQKIMEALFDFVSKDVRYVSIPCDSSGYKPHKASEIFKNKYGDCKDKSTLLISLYNEAGIDAYFALLRTRSAGKMVKEFPFFDLNHCIVALPKKEGGYSFLDPTIELGRFGYLNSDLQDVDIFVINKNGYEFVRAPVNGSEVSGSNTHINMVLKDDFLFEIIEKNEAFGDKEIQMRYMCKYLRRDAIKALFEKTLKFKYAKVKLKSFDFASPDNLNENFWLNLNYEVEDHIEQVGNLILFNLPVFSINTTTSEEKRQYPLWLPSLEKHQATISITVPPEYKIYQLPKEIKKDTPYASFELTISKNRNGIQVKSCIESKMLKIPVEQYAGYKELVESAEKAIRARIVLEKSQTQNL